MFASGYYWQRSVLAQPVQPLIARTHHFILTDGKPILKSIERIAVRSDGAISKARLDTSYELQQDVFRKLVFPNGRCYLIAPKQKLISSLVLDAKQLAIEIPAIGSPSGRRCSVGRETIYDDSVNGRSVNRVTIQQTMAGRNLMLTQWRDPQLACLALRSEAVEIAADGKVTRLAEDSVDLQLIEPPSDMFEIPVGYSEVKPSDLVRLTAAEKSVDPKLNQRWDQVDEQYTRSRLQ